MSPQLKARVGGAWVDTDRAGAVRVAGAWVPFAPPAGGPGYEALVWPDEPTLLNGNDGGQDYNMGIRFSVTADAPCLGIRWARTPTSFSGPPNGGSWVAALWRSVGELRLASVTFVPVAAAVDQDYLFAAPVALTAGELYVTSIFTRDYVYRSSAVGNPSSPSGLITADQGKLAASGDPLSYPASNQPAHYYIGPLIGVS